MENRRIRTWGIRSGHSHEIAAKIISYLQAQPVGSNGNSEENGGKSSEGWNEGWPDTLLELIYQAYTEFNSVETPEFKAIVNPLDETLRSLVETDGKTEAEVDEEADQYMNIVFELCSIYEHQSYIEGLKV